MNTYIQRKVYEKIGANACCRECYSRQLSFYTCKNSSLKNVNTERQKVRQKVKILHL